MADAIRRLLGLVPVLLVGSILLFFLLGAHPKVQRAGRLPLFFQKTPESAESAATRAMRGTAAGDEASARALQALGGAALPHVLPRLSEFGVAERRRIAEAMEPIATRMEIDGSRRFRSRGAGTDARSAEDQHLLAWERYYEDHDLDFRPLSVERLVRRLSSRSSSLREADLTAVDTYALPYLVEALGRVDSAADVQRIGRLAPAIARFLGPSFTLPPGADREAARNLASRIREEFDRKGAEFTDLGRFERMTAHLTQTEFGVFWIQTLRELRGIDTPVVYSTLALAFASSARLLTLAALGALLLGPLSAGLFHLASVHRAASSAPVSSARVTSNASWNAGRRTPRWLAFACAALLPPFCLLGPRPGPFASLLMLLTATLASAFTLIGELSDGVDWRSMLVIARRPLASRLRAVGLSLAMIMPTFLPLIAGEILLWVACVELSSGTDGLFPRTVRALERGDLHALLTLSLLSWTSIALLQTLSDALLSSIGERRRSW